MPRWNQLSLTPPDDCQIGPDCDLAPSVSWGRNVRLGRGVRLAPGVVLRDHVTLGDDVTIGPHSIVGAPTMASHRDPDRAADPTTVGDGSIVRAGAVIYEDVQIGPGFQCGPHVSIREGCRIGERCSVGNNGDIQPRVRLGDFTRIHSNVHVAADAVLGKYVWIMPGVMFTDDNLFPLFTHPAPPVVGPYSVIGARSFVYPGARLGMHVVVGAASTVNGTFDDFAFVKGDPGKRLCDARKFFVPVGDDVVFPYPWPRRVDRDYPWRDVPSGERRLEDYL